MNKRDFRDTFVLGLVSTAWVASTIFLFIHASVETFGIWAGMLATMGGIFHWLVVSDDKHPDA